MSDDRPMSEAAIRSLAAEIATRVRRGESRSAVRADLIDAGLSVDSADGLLAGVPSPARWPTGSVVGVVLSTLAMAVLPLAGLAGGCWLPWSQWPTSAYPCGMWVFGAMFISLCTVVIGLSVGVVLAYVAVRGISTTFARESGLDTIQATG